MNCRPLRLLSRLIAVALFSACVVLRADVVLDWNALMLDAIRADSPGPTLSTRNLAILHAAIYDAVNSVTRTHQPCQFQLTAPTNTSTEAAAVGAAYEVVVTLYPSFEAWADDLYDGWFSTNTLNAALTNGLNIGWQAAVLTVDSRNDDGSSTDVPYIPSDAPGQWQRTPPFFRPPLTPRWGYVDTFCLPDIEPFVPGPPPALDSAEYAAALNEVKVIGGKNSAARTTEQSQIAVFWSDFSYTAMPPGHWHEIAATIAEQRGNTLEQNARLFALISVAQADAAIVCWEAKFRYNLWRPITAIRRADEDANPATEKDAEWNDFLASPPFPAYVSGHSTFSKASAAVLAAFYGTDAISFTARSDTLAGITRSFTSLAACADEVGLSRVYGGIHFSFDNTAGKACGQRIGDYVVQNFLLPNAALPQVRLERLTNGTAQLRVNGHFGATCVLETSTNLRDWERVGTNIMVSGGMVITHTPASNSPVRFYRMMETIN